MMMNMEDYSNSDLIAEYAHLTQMETEACSSLPDWDAFNHAELEDETSEFIMRVEMAVSEFRKVTRDRKHEILKELGLRNVI